MKYMRRTAGYTWDRLQNKLTNCKGFKNNTNFGQITGIQEKLDTTCKYRVAQKERMSLGPPRSPDLSACDFFL